MYEVKDKEDPPAWRQNRIIGVKEISVRIGPTGGKRGYSAITGIPSWGIAWYLNDLLIPELHVERGETYSFSIEGGDNPTQRARYHPFYITNSEEGGMGQKTDGEQQSEKVYAGVERDSSGYLIPVAGKFTFRYPFVVQFNVICVLCIAAGRYCEWQINGTDQSEKIETFEDYMKTLYLFCEDGEPGVLNWTVPMEAPNTLYYQVSFSMK